MVVGEATTTALRTIRSQTVRQFFALAAQHTALAAR